MSIVYFFCFLLNISMDHLISFHNFYVTQVLFVSFLIKICSENWRTAGQKVTRASLPHSTIYFSWKTVFTHMAFTTSVAFFRLCQLHTEQQSKLKPQITREEGALHCFTLLSSHVTRTARSPRICPCSTRKPYKRHSPFL